MWPAPTGRSTCAPPGRSCCSTASSRSTTKAATTTDDDEGRLPQIMQGEPAEKRSVTPEQHFTQPPPRYTEATLVKRMEELGIGRPSTYASILTTIQDREYVRKDKNRLIPEDKGRLVTAFLTNYLPQLCRIRFHRRSRNRSSTTSRRASATTRKCSPGSGAISPPPSPKPPICASARCWTRSTNSWPRTSTPPRADGSDPRVCQVCGTGRLHLKTARVGRGLHRLRQLPRVPLHPPDLGLGRRGRDGLRRRPGSGPG